MVHFPKEKEKKESGRFIKAGLIKQVFSLQMKTSLELAV